MQTSQLTGAALPPSPRHETRNHSGIKDQNTKDQQVSPQNRLAAEIPSRQETSSSFTKTSRIHEDREVLIREPMCYQ
jgi:hypothetical protein